MKLTKLYGNDIFKKEMFLSLIGINLMAERTPNVKFPFKRQSFEV